MKALSKVSMLAGLAAAIVSLGTWASGPVSAATGPANVPLPCVGYQAPGSTTTQTMVINGQVSTVTQTVIGSLSQLTVLKEHNPHVYNVLAALGSKWGGGCASDVSNGPPSTDNVTFSPTQASIQPLTATVGSGTSPTYSGMERSAATSGQYVTDASGYFPMQPADGNGGSNNNVAYWVGVGGINWSYLAQAGIDAFNCDKAGDCTYEAFAQNLPTNQNASFASWSPSMLVADSMYATPGRAN